MFPSEKEKIFVIEKATRFFDTSDEKLDSTSKVVTLRQKEILCDSCVNPLRPNSESNLSLQYQGGIS